MYPQPGPYGSPSGSPFGPVPPLPGERPPAMQHVRWVQFAAAAIVAIQGILSLIFAADAGRNGPYLSTAATGQLIGTVIQVGLIITVAIQSHQGINAWRIVGTICAGITVITSLFSLTGTSMFFGVRLYRGADSYAVVQMLLSGLLAAAAITAIVMWWTRDVNRWFDGWTRVRRYAAATGIPVPPVR